MLVEKLLCRRATELFLIQIVFFFTNFFFFWLCFTARGILVPQPGIEPVPPAVEARSPNPWTAREVLIQIVLKLIIFGFPANNNFHPPFQYLDILFYFSNYID